jgi:uncharacterized membrane protein
LGVFEGTMRSLPFAAAEAAVSLVLTLVSAATTPAAADFKLCNFAGGRVGISIGYKDGDRWTTEGWWNLGPKDCEIVIKGPLVSRFYYIYAFDYDRGGEWSGQNFMCTQAKQFTIRGTEDCLAHGFDRTGFFEVDTGEQRDWQVHLTDSGDQAPTQPLQSGSPSISTPPAGRSGPLAAPPAVGMPSR